MPRAKAPPRPRTATEALAVLLRRPAKDSDARVKAWATPMAKQRRKK